MEIYICFKLNMFWKISQQPATETHKIEQPATETHKIEYVDRIRQRCNRRQLQAVVARYQ